MASTKVRHCLKISKSPFVSHLPLIRELVTVLLKTGLLSEQEQVEKEHMSFAGHIHTTANTEHISQVGHIYTIANVEQRDRGWRGLGGSMINPAH